MKVLHPPQIGLMCGDIDEMVRFYTEGLGLPLIQDRLQPAGMDRFVYIVGMGTSFLKLWGFDQKPWSRSLPPRGPDGRADQLGLRYLTIMIGDDVGAVCDRLESLGFAVPERGHRGRTGFPVTVAFVQDPDGNWLELMQLDDPDWWPYERPAEEASTR